MKWAFIAGATLLAVITAAGLTGCDTESAAENNVRITPGTATLRINQMQEFTASGGFDYTWSLENEDWGTLSAREGNSTVYQSLHDPGAEAETARQILRVTSTINSQGQNGTNETSYSHTAEAIITHETSELALQIQPPNASLQQWESQSFTASGAHSYSWSLDNETWGTLTAREGSTTTYTSTKATATEGLQTLICDTDRGRVTAHIIHEPQAVSITPSVATVTPGNAASFTASGADFYVWSATGGGNPLNYDFSSVGNQAVVSHLTTTTLGENETATLIVTVSAGGSSANATVILSNPSTPF